MPFPGPNGAVIGYTRIRPTTADREQFGLPQQDFVFDSDSGSYVEEPPVFDAGFNLTADGWVARTEENALPVLSANADGSADQQSALLRAPQRATINAVDLSGRLLRSYARGIDFQDRAARFPSGAVGYRMAVSTRNDEYLAFEEDSDNPELAALTTLDDVISAFGPSGTLLKTFSGLKLQLRTGGVVRFSSGREEMLLPLAGNWRRRTVEGAEVLEIAIPGVYKDEFEYLDATTDLFISIVNGHARTGTVTRTGFADTQDYYLLNKTAFDAVVAGAVAYDDATAVFGQVAADGYVEGATVFLDLNDNGLRDAGEPAETTNSLGEYALFWSERDFAAHSLGVLVPAGAMIHLPDVEDSFSATQPFTLRAPPGETFITPYTTLAWHVVETTRNTSYGEALTAIATTVAGADIPLNDYMAGADATQAKVRLVAALVSEKLKEVRGRFLATSADASTIVLNPDLLAVYRSILATTYEVLPTIVTGAESLLATPPAGDTTLDSVIDPEVWSQIGENLFIAILSSFYEAYKAVLRAVVVNVVADLVSMVLEEIPYVGWFLGPAAKCSILTTYDLPCD